MREICLMSIFGKDHVLLALAGSELRSLDKFQEIISLLREQYDHLIRSYLVLGNKLESVQPGTNALVDSAGQLAETYGNTPAFYLVRPDGYIAFRCRAAQPHLLRDYLSKLFTGIVPGR